MPVQEQDTRKPQEQQPFDLDEKKPTSFEQSGKLLPFLEAKAEFHQVRIDTIDEKIARREDKIARNEAKIEKMAAKAEKLEDLNETLKTLADNNPLAKALVERNEKKIAEIKDVLIPKREAKIDAHNDRISALRDKRRIIEHKLDRTVALSKTITSFALFGAERRETFRAAMDELHKATARCLNDRINVLKTKQIEIGENAPASGMDGLKARRRMSELQEKIDKIQAKVTAYEELNDTKTDKLMEHTAETISESMDRQDEDISAADIAETVCVESADFTEKSLGLNADREALLVQRKELQAELDSNKEVLTMPIGNEIKALAQAEIDKLAPQIAELDKQLADMPEFVEKSEEHIEPATDLQIDVMAKHGFGSKDKIRADGWSVAEASKVIQAISDNNWIAPPEIKVYHSKAEILAETENYLKNAELSSEQNADMIDGIINNGADSQEIAGTYDDVERAADEQARAEMSADIPKTTISAEQAVSELESTGKTNPDFYKSLPKEDRKVSQSLPLDDAKKVMTALAAQSISFSAVVRKNGMAAIATDKKDSQALDSVIAQVQSERAVSQPAKSENTVHIESPANAKKIMQALSEQGIPCKSEERTGKYGDYVTISVPTQFEQTYKQTANDVKAQKAEFINPDFYKALPKEERFTQRMDADKASAVSAELTKQGVQHSAVIDGKDSAVTVAKKDKPKLSFGGSFRNNVKKRIQSYQQNHKDDKSQQKGRSGNGLGE